MRKIYHRQLLALSCFLTGCTVGPSYQEPPALDMPAEWHSIKSEEQQQINDEQFIWWEALGDPLLNSLIERAAKQNLDLFIAGTRILQARAEYRGKEAEKYPRLDASMSGGHVYYSKDAIVKGLLNGYSKSHSHDVKRSHGFFELGFDASWEIDLFGAAAHDQKALQAKIEASEESLNDQWVTLSAEIARHYIQLRSSQQRLIIIEKNIESQQDTLHLTEELVRIGMASSIEQLQIKEQLNNLILEKPLIKSAIDQSIHRLSILLGYQPAELFCELAEPQKLPSLPSEKPVNLPSELLRRRPDIRRAERELAAATESVGSAVASLFPRLSLKGFIGQIGTQLHSLTRSAGTTWFAAPEILAPIFNSELIKQDIEFNKIQTKQALFTYQKTVLEALEEVENTLAAFNYENEKNHYLIESRQNLQQTYQSTVELYERGIKDYLEVLIINRSLLATEDSFIQSQADLLLHYIALYKALGGEWCENSLL